MLFAVFIVAGLIFGVHSDTIDQLKAEVDQLEKVVEEAGPPTGGGQLGHFAPGPSLKGAPGGPMKGPLNTCLKDRYTLIEQSDLNTLIEQSQYSSEEQCSKLIDKEIWLVMGSYCHCQQVVTFFFFFFFGLHLTTWVKGPTLTLCPGPLNFSGRPWEEGGKRFPTIAYSKSLRVQ